ncbi:MAG: DUF3786 domain-containing protein [Deltaproteobacteria bacterium]|nr:DUF3786 domain-containing protein [Deltaproteobacteria bacterium]
MDATDPEENALYRTADGLHPLHWETLRQRDPTEAARAAGAEIQGGALRLFVLGRHLRVDPGAERVRFEDEPAREVGYQRALVAVAYLAGALEAPPRGEWVAFRELPGGDAFFRGPHSLATPRLEKAFGPWPERLVEAARRLGGAWAPGADAAADLAALPRIPLRILLWRATAEFPASATVLTDARAHLHLPLDVLWALTNVAVADLVRGTG